jgi:hypothetical protein
VCLGLTALSALGATGGELGPGLAYGTPIVAEQLAVIPIVRTEQAKAAGDFLTLAQGLKEKLVKVSELEGGASVNEVRVANRSDRRLLLLGGELILGGQQDRIIGSDTVIEPKTTTTVAVFCVEHGRWQGQGQFGHSGGLAEGKLRRVAKFDKAQGDVWGQVAKKTGALKASSATGTYRTLATGEEGKKAAARFASVKEAFLKVPEAEVVGVAASVNGVVRSVDVFATPELFRAYRDSLLESAFIDAADATPEAGKAPPTAVEVKAFMDNADVASPAEVSRNKAGHTVEKKGKDVVNSTLSTQSNEPIYRSYQNAKY